jgi:ribosomal protein S18 acetylase RimI-like enzyme
MGQLVEVRSARNEDVDRYVNVLMEAFPDKFLSIFGERKEAGGRALTGSFHPLEEHGGHFIAEVDGQVAGVLHLAYRGNDGGHWRALPFLLHLGPIRALRALIAFSLIERRPDIGEAYIAHIAIRPGFQGRGLGKALMEAAETTSREQKLKKVGLHVACDNSVAKALYSRQGFQVVKVERSEMTRRLIGKQCWEFMVKDLQNGGCSMTKQGFQGTSQ